ncbi:hypothetical protein DYH09_24575 [bacterium CPR1]|nr:hypothetical protein [bacterium CPR1]
METRLLPTNLASPPQANFVRQPIASSGSASDPLDEMVASSASGARAEQATGSGATGAPQPTAKVRPSSPPVATSLLMEEPPRGRPTGVVLHSTSHLAHPELLPTLTGHLDAGRPVVVTGTTGSGKNALVREVARQGGAYAPIGCSSDLQWGHLAPGPGGQFAWQDDLLGEALSRPGLVHLDEIHLLSGAVQTQLAKLLSSGEVAIENRPLPLKLHPETRFAATLHKGERLQDDLAEVLGVPQHPVEVQRMLHTASQVAAWARQEGRALPLSPLDCQTARRSTLPISQEDEARVDLGFLRDLHQAGDDLGASDYNRALGADPDPMRKQIRAWKEDPPPWMAELGSQWPGYRHLEHGLWRLAQTAPEHGEFFARLVQAHEGDVEKSLASLTRVLASERTPEQALESELRALAGIPEPTAGGGLRQDSGGLTVGGTFLRRRSRS